MSGQQPALAMSGLCVCPPLHIVPVGAYVDLYLLSGPSHSFLPVHPHSPLGKGVVVYMDRWEEASRTCTALARPEELMEKEEEELAEQRINDKYIAHKSTKMSYPHWLGLLKWSLGHSDGTADSQFKEMSDEDRVWLDKVMSEMVKDEPKRMSEILKIFSEILDRGVTAADESSIEGMLDEVQSIIDQIDMADIFVRFGGIKALLGFLQSSELSDELKKSVCVILGDLAQNNPPVQESFLTYGVLDELCVAAASHANPAVCAKALYAVSCTIRGFATGENRFCSELKGSLLFVRLLERNDILCSRRVYFLATALVSSDYSTALRNIDIAEKLVPSSLHALSMEDMEVRDNALHFLSAVALSREGRTVIRSICSDSAKQMPSVTDEQPHLGQLEEALSRRSVVVRAAITADKEALTAEGEDAATSDSFAEESAAEEGRRVAALRQQLKRGYDEDCSYSVQEGQTADGSDDQGNSTKQESMMMISNT